MVLDFGKQKMKLKLKQTSVCMVLFFIYIFWPFLFFFQISNFFHLFFFVLPNNVKQTLHITHNFTSSTIFFTIFNFEGCWFKL